MPEPAKNAANDKPVTATWRDREWSVPAPTDWPWDVLEAIDDEKFSKALRGLLSAEDYEAFKKLKPTVTDGGDLLNELVKAGGFEDAGE